MTFGIQRRIAYLFIVAIALALSVMLGCENEEEGGGGTLQVLMTDAATDQYNAVYVTVDQVAVNRSDDDAGWVVIGAPGKTSNLLGLVNGVTEELGLSDLESGSYSQVRLRLGTAPDEGTNINGQSHPFANYLIMPDGSVHELKVPSGLQSGIKIGGGFNVAGGDLTTLILDFDASRSVVQAGNSGQWLLKPTITMHAANESSLIRGTISGSGVALAGARVSAQIIGDAGVAPVIAAATVSGDNGGYLMDVAPGDYTVVAARRGFRSACGQVSVGSGDTVLDLALSPVITGMVSGTVTIANASAEATATISVRAGLDCGGASFTLVEITRIQVVNGSDYSLTLPAGTFALVYASDNDSGSETVIIEANTNQNVDIEL